MYLLDTNICIYIMKNSYPALTDRLLRCKPEDVAISSITLFELEYGACKSRWGDRTRDKLYTFLAPFNILPFDDKDAVCAGYLRALMAREGSPIGPYDIQIAAQAYSRDLTIVTRNTKEFSRILDLKVEDWLKLS